MTSNSSTSVATAAFRLSAQQERAWLERERGVPQFAQAVIGIEGPVNSAMLSAAVRQVVSKFEILRTSLRRQTGVKLPFQVIQEDAAFHFEQNSDPVEKVVVRERQLLSDAESSAPLRAVLVNEPHNRHALILTLPVFYADSATLTNLCHEILSSYAGVAAASDDVMQYADLVEWQNELLASDETKPGRDFWRESCTRIDFSSLDSFSLPLEKSRDAQFAPSSLTMSISELSRGIDALAASSKSLSANVILAAWNALLSRLAGSSELTIGCEFDGRRYEELAAALGPLARSLPVRLELDPKKPFHGLLQEIETATTEARNWQESFSWGNVCEGEPPVLPLAFAYHDLGKTEVQGGVSFRLERLQVVSERFKLRLVAVRRESENGPDLELQFDYDAARLERSTVERIAGYFQILLAAAIANPESAVSRLPLLSEAERTQLVVEWNQTEAAYPANQCLHQLFEQQAGRTPERMAVRCGEQAFTYRGLNERANQLAHYLRKHGVGPDRPVGLCLERSAETMVAVLAILKAGGAYVPLNPDNPPARLQQQLAGAAALITESKLAAQMPEFSGAMLVLDRDQKLWANELTTNPESNTTPDNLVYVIYTSGSTGVPKGVAVRHRNLVNYSTFITKRLDLEKYPEGLQFATVSTLGADLGNTCIYPSLISGGGLHIVGYEMATDPHKFAEYVSQHPIDVLKIVPSHLQALIQSDDAKKILPRKYLIFGGETLTPKLLEKIEALNPQCEILNHYGPTETTVGSLTLKLKDYDWRKARLASIPIGRPIANTQVYVLDANLEPVPVGVIGELYIAGAGVTAGYLGQPEKTAERFVNNRFAQDQTSAGTKMYRTGDLARYGEDGNIEFLGRGDDQVKIRGFRIELGEIEAVLARHASVKQVVVLAREDEQGEKRLLAYVVPIREQATKEAIGEDLRAYVKQQLPDYMVPQAVMVLPKLPLTPNGKIDRQALPEPEQAAQTRTYIAPRTPTENAIAEIWAEVLRREKDKIGVEDNFFDLGGHSLLATQVISRVRERFVVEIPMRIMFDHPRITGLAQAVEQAVQSVDNAEEMTIAPVSRDAYRT